MLQKLIFPFSVIFAIAIPRLGLFISLVGALCLSMLGIAFPAIIELCVLWPDKLGPLKLYLWKDLLLIVFGIIGLFVGTYINLVDIIKSFSWSLDIRRNSRSSPGNKAEQVSSDEDQLSIMWSSLNQKWSIFVQFWTGHSGLLT